MAVRGLRRTVAAVRACVRGLALAAGVVVFASPAMAQLVDNGSSMVDAGTGLEWLDLTETQGLSWNQAEASSFVTALGYRHATLDEVTTLFLNAGFLSVPAPNDPANDPAAALLLSVLGCTDACGAGPNQVGRGFALAADGTTTVRPNYHAGGLGAGAAGASLFNADLDLVDTTAGHFLVRKEGTADPFTIVIFGDTQTYTHNDPLLPVLANMVDYVIANVDALDIDLVVHVGDVIQSGPADFATPGSADQWAKFNAEWKRLDPVVPYVIVRGNHDNSDEFKLHYGPSHFGQLDGLSQPVFPYYVDTHPGESDDASAFLVNLGGQDTVVLGTSCNPSPSELAWMQGHLDAHKQDPAIVVNHILTLPDGVHFSSNTLQPSCSGNGPVSVWEELVEPNANQVFMTASGHVISDVGYKRVVGVGGERILDTFENWQGPGRSALGCLALVHVRPGVEEVEVETYCTELNGGAGGYRVLEGVTSLTTTAMHFQVRDSDDDGELDTLDNCPRVANPGQEDDDADGVGNACEIAIVDLALPGDGLLTYDSNTGLSWLHLSQTVGMSVDEVESEMAPGGIFEEFRFADHGEVMSLLADAGIPDIDVPATPANVAPVTTLLNSVGTTVSPMGAEGCFDDGTPVGLVGSALLDSDGVTALAVLQDDVRDRSVPDPAVASWLVLEQPLPTPQDPGTVTYDLVFDLGGGVDLPIGTITIDAASVAPGVQVSLDELGGASFWFSDGHAAWSNADQNMGAPRAFVTFDEAGAIVGLNLTVLDFVTGRELVIVTGGTWSSDPGTAGDNDGSYSLVYSEGTPPPPTPLVHAEDLFVSGDGLLTIDDVTKFAWLNLYSTAGMSFNEALASTYVADLGFRPATEAEVADLLMHAGFVALDNLGDPANDFAAALMLEHMGCTNFCGSQNELGRGFATRDAVFTTRPMYRESPLGGAAVSLSLLTPDRDLVDVSAGTFLVREPPVLVHVPISPLARWLITASLFAVGVWSAGRSGLGRRSQR